MKAEVDRHQFFKTSSPRGYQSVLQQYYNGWHYIYENWNIYKVQTSFTIQVIL